VCTCIWTFNLATALKDLEQTVHTKGRSVIWIFFCLFLIDPNIMISIENLPYCMVHTDYGPYRSCSMSRYYILCSIRLEVKTDSIVENNPCALIEELTTHQHNRIDRICRVVPLYGPASYEPLKVGSMLFHNHIDYIWILWVSELFWYECWDGFEYIQQSHIYHIWMVSHCCELQYALSMRISDGICSHINCIWNFSRHVFAC